MPDPVSATTQPADTDRDAVPRRTRGRHRKNQRRIPRWVEYPALIILVGLITFSVQTFLFRVYVIPSESMEQTLYGCAGCTDDRVLVDRVVYDFKSPQPGDVVVFKGPPGWTDNEVQAGPPTTALGKFGDWAGQLIGLTPASEVDFVKRVIAVGGQTLYCCDANNHVVVDGKALTEPYIYWWPGRGTKQASFGPVTVPPGELFVMGDNRNDSDDSRIQAGGGVKGAIPVSDVIGKVRTIIWPFSRIGGVGDQNPQAAALIGVLPMAYFGRGNRWTRRTSRPDRTIGRHAWWRRGARG
ncbi:MAG TPA: signal peptidase I [Pseudonocardiaceae bacterium]|nr:signal peptidase I [Pseudonocardiaceae bacterium]